MTFSTSYYDVQQALVALKGTPIVTKHTPADLKKYVFGDQVGTTSLAFINSQIQPTQTPKVYETLNDVKQALQTHQIAALVTDTPTAQYISSSEIKHSVMVGQFPSTGEHYGLLFHKGNPLVTCVNKALATLNQQRHAGRAAEEVPADLPDRAHHQALMTGPPQTSFGAQPGAGRGCSAAAAARWPCPRPARSSCWPRWPRCSWLAPGSAAVRHTFFNPQDMWHSFIGDPKAGYYSVGAALWLNIRMFLAAEVLILILALVIAVVRQSASPVMFPLRIVSTIYVDVFRGVPLILVIFAIGFGVPALNLAFISTQSAAVYGVVALVLSYSAYVSEVYRAGLNSVHQSQVAAARSLGPVASGRRCAT